jgi:hypothetical protein
MLAGQRQDSFFGPLLALTITICIPPYWGAGGSFGPLFPPIVGPPLFVMQVIQHIVDYAEAHGRSETILRFFSAIVKCVLHCTVFLGAGLGMHPRPWPLCSVVWSLHVCV